MFNFPHAQGGAKHGEGAAESGGVWIGGTEGFVRVDASRLAELKTLSPFATIIRHALTTAPADAQPQFFSGGLLPYARNSGRFEFAANTYAISAGVRYQTRLAGFESGSWSESSERTSVDYTNLPEGR